MNTIRITYFVVRVCGFICAKGSLDIKKEKGSLDNDGDKSG